MYNCVCIRTLDYMIFSRYYKIELLTTNHMADDLNHASPLLAFIFRFSHFSHIRDDLMCINIMWSAERYLNFLVNGFNDNLWNSHHYSRAGMGHHSIGCSFLVGGISRMNMSVHKSQRKKKKDHASHGHQKSARQ